MYRAIIIDDEETVRSGLRSHFNWEIYGLTIVADFPDCAKAYEYIRENPVDLAVTDVITPVMDGITFAKKLREEYPAIKVVFISGHADVELLRDALKTDAIDYILKSVDLDELAVTVRRVVDLLDKRSDEKKRVQRMEEQLEEMRPLMQERFLRSLLSSDNDLSEAAYLGLDLDMVGRYVCMVIRLVNKWSTFVHVPMNERFERSRICDLLCEDAAQTVSRSISFKNKISEFVILLHCGDGDYEQDVLDVSAKIQKDFMESLHLEVSIGISEPIELSHMKDAYKEAREAIEQHYYVEKNSLIAVKKYKEVPDVKTAREMAEKQLPDAILSGDTNRVQEVLNQTFAHLRHLPEEDQDNFILFLINLPTRLLVDLKTNEKGAYSDQRRLMESWLNCEGRGEQERFVRTLMQEVTELLDEMNEPGNNALIRMVQNAISERYMEQLSVTMLAEEVHLTPTYLCVLFKQSTGKTINEYLTAERISRAKTLLKDPEVRLYDICYQVGYLSPSYFSKLFKRQTGMTPGEYRDKVIS